MHDPQPLLTIAIPTYNRAADLSVLLTALEPQLVGHPEVDLFVSDNCSPDATEQTVAAFITRGMRIRYQRQPENIGSDRNFVTCFEQAQGEYFWICGDDDIILPGTLDKVLDQLRTPLDLIYLTSFGFTQNYSAERTEDPLNRRIHTFSSALKFTKVVNIMFTFMSAMVVNRNRLLALNPEPPRAFLSTNLTQLSWCLPLLPTFRRGVVLWDRPLAARQGNAGGYALGTVFGTNLKATVARLLPDHPELQATITNFTLRRWLPSIMVSMRAANNQRIGLEAAQQQFQSAYGQNWRFWLFAVPVMRLPLPLARVWLKLGAAASMLIYVLTVRNFWRKET